MKPSQCILQINFSATTTKHISIFSRLASSSVVFHREELSKLQEQNLFLHVRVAEKDKPSQYWKAENPGSFSVLPQGYWTRDPWYSISTLVGCGDWYCLQTDKQQGLNSWWRGEHGTPCFCASVYAGGPWSSAPILASLVEFVTLQAGQGAGRGEGGSRRQGN